jgi:hypothetical protein
MEQVLKIEEIENQFDSEWVLLAEPQTDEQFNVIGGKVLYHSPDRIKFDRETLKLNLGAGEFAVIYTGQPSAEMEYAL